MSTITRESLEALEAAVDMVDLVGGRTPLRRSGARYVGRCPFHDERTPSFSVDPLKKVYYCFGCQRGGDHIKFVRETENLDFAAAVETLAERYGVRLEYEQSSPEEERRRAQRGRLLRLLDDAAGFYARYLWESAEAEPAREYLAGRGIAEETARDFRLGFAPSAWDRVCAAALAKGFTAAELSQAGLSGRGRRGPVDRFRARLMFPLADVRGRVRGFGARQMPGGEPPKYLNSTEGPLFRKAEMVYGLDRARAAIASAGRAIVVEGYTDVLALHQAGFDNTVASMGTALTDAQVTELRRVCSAVSLAFDADAAGEEASLRGMAIAEGKGLAVQVVALPPHQILELVEKGGILLCDHVDEIGEHQLQEVVDGALHHLEPAVHVGFPYGELGLLEVGALREVGAVVLPVGIQEEVVDGAVDVVVMGDVALRAAGRVGEPRGTAAAPRPARGTSCRRC